MNTSDNPADTYTVRRPDGMAVLVTVPDDPTPEDALQAALQDAMSPDGVAALYRAVCVDHLTGLGRSDQRAEIVWFANTIADMIGEAHLTA